MPANVYEDETTMMAIEASTPPPMPTLFANAPPATVITMDVPTPN
jgi:hypothetical protein